MPHVTIQAIEGKEDQLKAVADDIVKSFVKHGISDKWVTIRLQEYPHGQWMEKVYTPVIENGPGELLREPHYTSV